METYGGHGLLILIAAAMLFLAGCAEPLPEALAQDPYEACIERGYQLGDLPYSATTFYQPTAVDRFWPRTIGRATWRSPVEQCNELRNRGQLTPN
ncbi:MAG TPA: hypothetical protein VGB82_03870 [Alphaproteobacteria bacterium]